MKQLFFQQPTNQDSNRDAALRRFWLHRLLVASTVANLLVLIVSPFHPVTSERNIALAMSAVLLGTHLLVAILARRGYQQLAGISLTCIYIVVTNVGLLTIGSGLRSPLISVYFLAIAAALLMLTGRWPQYISIMSIVSVPIIYWAEQQSMLFIMPLQPTLLVEALILMLCLVLAFMLQSWSLQHIRRNAFLLAQANTNLTLNQGHLREARDVLEKRVKERTAELSIANNELTQKIAERRQIEGALRQSEQRFRTLVEGAFEGFAIIVDNQFQFANEPLARLLRMPIDELLGRTPHDIFEPSAAEAIQRILMQESEQSQELVGTFRDGTSIAVEIISRAIVHEGQSGRIVGFTDIQERKKTEAALRESHKLESLGLLAGGVAHDFNNLLVAMLAQNSVALAKLPPESVARKNIEKAVRAAEQAAGLSRQLLAYTGKGQVDSQPLQINALLEENKHLFEVALPSNVHLDTRLKEPLPSVTADPAQMQQVIMNLIINAADAIGEKQGTITMLTDTRILSKDETNFWNQTNTPLVPGHYVTLEVHDDGAGMDADTKQKIFDPFFTTKTHGRGLGLAAVIGIMRSHGAGLRVYSEIGKGTTFKLLFPATEELVVEQDDRPVRPRLEPHDGYILVIDDEQSVLEAVQDVLELEGLDVLTAQDGYTGIELYRQHGDRIHLVLLDLTMPGINGEDTFKQLCQLDPSVRVVLASGYNELEATRQFIGRGLAGFLQKPFSLVSLVETVQLYLSEPAPEVDIIP